MVGIYKITSPSNKIYIGQSWNVKKRWYGYKSPSCDCGKHHTHLCNSLKKYGVNTHLFEFICNLPEDMNQDVLNNYEQIYLDFYRNCGAIVLNIREAGSKGKLSEETKRKIGLAQLGNIPWNKGLKRELNPLFGIPRTDEVKQKVGNINKLIQAKLKEENPELYKEIKTKQRAEHLGKKHSEETKKKMSIAHKGKSTWQKGLTKETDERLKKKYEARIGFITSEETKKKLSEKTKAYWEKKRIESPIN